MIHSIISMDDIFCNMDSCYPNTVCKPVNGGIVELTDYCGEKRVNRLYSTDPYMYLDKRYTPFRSYK